MEGAYDIGCRGGAYYSWGEGGVAEWFVAVRREKWQRMLLAFQKLCPTLSTHWGHSWTCTGRRARISSMFHLWGEEWGSYYALVWLLSTWLAHGMPKATLDFSTQWSCPRCWGSSVSSAFTSHTQWSCMVLYVLCLPKWMRNYGLETQSSVKRWNWYFEIWWPDISVD